MLRHFVNYQVTVVKLNKCAEKYVLNKQGKFDVKIFLCYIDTRFSRWDILFCLTHVWYNLTFHFY